MDSPKKPVKVRFAPSPTGPFSIGNARTALFNWLFAKREGGEFLLRIEDTDGERSKKKFEKDILDGLKWLGLEWDEKLIRQSERLGIYESHLQKLLKEKKAYYCFCTPEELEVERQAQLSQGLAPKYSGRCRSLTADGVGKPAVIRFKMPEKKVVISDAVKGKVEFDTTLLGDIIIAKSLKEPLYNFAAAVDDVEMGVTHVIRGEDHLSNTPKQIVIQEALGLDHPIFAHLPLILGPDRKKLSKRHSEVSLNDYKSDGYLPQAVLNFLVLLGWHPARDREILSVSEMIDEFSLQRVQKSGAIFNPEKLDWLNAHYIKQTSFKDLLFHLKPFIPRNWLQEKKLVLKILEVEKERVKNLKEFSSMVRFFFELPDYPKTMLIWKQTDVKTTLDNLKKVLDIIKSASSGKLFRKSIEEQIMTFAEREGRGEVLWPLRVALSGQEVSPGPIDLIDALGKKETVKRVKIAIKKIES